MSGAVGPPPSYESLSTDKKDPVEEELPPSYEKPNETQEFSQQTSEKTYEDKFVKVTSKGIEIKCFYFPIGTKKCIPFEDIEAIHYKKQVKWDDYCNVKGWGMALSPCWWACDVKRNIPSANKNYYNVVVSNGESTFKGFTVTDIKKFLDVVRLSCPAPAKNGFPF